MTNEEVDLGFKIFDSHISFTLLGIKIWIYIHHPPLT